MLRITRDPKEITLNLRLDTALKAEFMAATKAEAMPAAEVLRSLIREYVRLARRKAFLTEAARQSRLIAASPAVQSDDDEAEAMQWVENVSAPLPKEPDKEWFRLPNDRHGER